MRSSLIGLLFTQILCVNAEENLDNQTDFLYKTEFNNGVNVILCEDFKMPIAIIGIIFDIGEVDNPVGNFAMVQLVADNLVSKELNDQLLLIGADYSINVTDRYTEIFVTLPPRYIKKFFNLISEELKNIKIQNMRAAKNTIALQYKMRSQHFKNAVTDNIFANIYLNRKKPGLIFNEHEMKKITESAVKNFFFDHYVDCSLTIIVAGAVGRKKLVKVLHSSIGKMPPRKSMRALKNITANHKEVMIANKFLNNSLFYIYKIPQEFNTSFLNAFLNIFSYELFTYLQKLQPMLNDFNINTFLNQKDSLLYVTLEPKFNISFNEIINAYEYVISRILTQKFSDDYLEKLSNNIKNRYIIKYNNLYKKYAKLKDAYLSLNGTKNIFNTSDQIKNANEDVIKSYTSEIFLNNFIMRITTKHRTH